MSTGLGPSPQAPPHLGKLTQADIAVLVVSMALPTLAAWLYFVEFADSGFVLAFYWGGKIVQFGLPLPWVLFVQRSRISLRPRTTSGLTGGLLLGAGIAAGILGLYYGVLRDGDVLALLSERLGAKLRDFGLDEPWRFVVFAAFIALIHSFLEEYYWRWFVFGQLRKNMPFFWAAALSSIAFMGHHVVVIDSYMRPEQFWSVTMLFSAAVALGGFLWAWIYERTRSLLGAWVSHILVDVGIMFVGYDQVWGAVY